MELVTLQLVSRKICMAEKNLNFPHCGVGNTEIGFT